MDFNGSNAGENIDVSANGSRVRLTRNIAAITMDFAGIEGLNVRALGGADTVTVNDLSRHRPRQRQRRPQRVRRHRRRLTPTPSSPTAPTRPDDVDVSSDAGKDVVSRASTKVSVTGGEPALDNVNVATLGGADTIDRRRRLRRDHARSPSTAATGADTTTYSGTRRR